MDEKLKKALECCSRVDCCACPKLKDVNCMSNLYAEVKRYIDELEERIAIMQESMEALERILKNMEWNLLTEDSDGIIHGLPGDDGQYIMTDGKEIWIDDYVDGVTDGIILDSGRDIREIKAWMYMPELPKTYRR